MTAQACSFGVFQVSAIYDISIQPDDLYAFFSTHKWRIRVPS